MRVCGTITRGVDAMRGLQRDAGLQRDEGLQHDAGLRRGADLGLDVGSQRAPLLELARISRVVLGQARRVLACDAHVLPERGQLLARVLHAAHAVVEPAVLLLGLARQLPPPAPRLLERRLLGGHRGLEHREVVDAAHPRHLLVEHLALARVVGQLLLRVGELPRLHVLPLRRVDARAATGPAGAALGTAALLAARPCRALLAVLRVESLALRPRLLELPLQLPQLRLECGVGL